MSKEDIQQAISAAFYTPKGNRSLNGGRNARFGQLDLRACMERANREVMCIPMIEDREGIENLDEILSVDGIDFVLEGAADLSGSYGVPWETRHPRIRQALFALHERASALGIPYGAVPRNKEDMKTWWEKGVRIFVMGDDRGICYRAMRAHLSEYVNEVQVKKDE